LHFVPERSIGNDVRRKERKYSWLFIYAPAFLKAGAYNGQLFFERRSILFVPGKSLDTVRISVGRGKDGFYRPAFLGLKYLFRQRESQEGPNHFSPWATIRRLRKPTAAF
jgi:hypothetical protein